MLNSDPNPFILGVTGAGSGGGYAVTTFSSSSLVANKLLVNAPPVNVYDDNGERVLFESKKVPSGWEIDFTDFTVTGTWRIESLTTDVTLVNGESYVFDKPIKNRRLSVSSSAPLESGTITAFTGTSVTDSTKTFSSSLVGKAVAITSGGAFGECRIITSVNAGTANLEYAFTRNPANGDSYQIVEVTNIRNEDLSVLYAFDMSHNHAVRLPEISETFDGCNAEIYIENYNTAGVFLAVVARAADVLHIESSTAKQGLMVARGELIELSEHYSTINHWSLINAENILAIGVSKNGTFYDVTTNTGTGLELKGHTLDSLSRRFIKVPGTESQIRYISTISKLFNIQANANLSYLTSNSSNVNMRIKKNGVIQTGFNGRAGFLSANVTNGAVGITYPTQLNYGDIISVETFTSNNLLQYRVDNSEIIISEA
jgi:hypothetical protein